MFINIRYRFNYYAFNSKCFNNPNGEVKQYMTLPMYKEDTIL